ncbi:winged helix-turn-helix domain-containing protein [Ruicaihuangia caeni]|uniref:winged helix-turn-helix domain-containing protein n=1 Tax=Ruicaihuangia caeni TaxID=3042517 RepID=UPI00338F9AC8
MPLATLERPLTSATPVLRRAEATSAPARVAALAASSSAPVPTPAEEGVATPTPDQAPQARQNHLRSVPEGTEARGFALYVGLDEETAAAAGVDLGTVVDAVKRLVGELVPSAQTHAAVALAPKGAGGRDVDVVRLALREPTAVARVQRKPAVQEEPAAQAPRPGIVVDLSRKRVLLDGETAALTFKEFELLQFLVLREGRTVERTELIEGLWSGSDAETPNERTIDVHVRRLRSKLGNYDDIVRTVRGRGYRFDRHADVSIRHTSTPSPDVF